MHEHDIERELDAALARYSAAEPHGGLEQRVLANLRAHDARPAGFAWKHWVAAGFATAILAGLAIWAGGRRPPMVNINPVVFKHEAVEAGGSVSAVFSKNDLNLGRTEGHSQGKLMARRAQRRRKARVAAASLDAMPKLAQFPAPEPLTEQERLLIQFVEQDPEGAALFAEVRAKELQRASDEMKLLEDGTDSQEGQTY